MWTAMQKLNFSASQIRKIAPNWLVLTDWSFCRNAFVLCSWLNFCLNTLLWDDQTQASKLRHLRTHNTLEPHDSLGPWSCNEFCRGRSLMPTELCFHEDPCRMASKLGKDNNAFTGKNGFRKISHVTYLLKVSHRLDKGENSADNVAFTQFTFLLCCILKHV